MKNLDGKIALVTGAAQGLGKAISAALAHAGATVYMTDVNGEHAKKSAEEIAELGGLTHVATLNVSHEVEVTTVIGKIISEEKRLDILINNAGIDFTKSVEELKPTEWDAVIAVNLRGPFLLSKFALVQMSKQQSGHIVNIASTAALRAWENASAYHASKWALRGFSQALFLEARKSLVKVTTIIAGGMKTPFLLERFPDIDQTALQDPQNVAEAVLFALTQPEETVIPEMLVLPLKETSWP